MNNTAPLPEAKKLAAEAHSLARRGRRCQHIAMRLQLIARACEACGSNEPVAAVHYDDMNRKTFRKVIKHFGTRDFEIDFITKNGIVDIETDPKYFAAFKRLSNCYLKSSEQIHLQVQASRREALRK